MIIAFVAVAIASFVAGRVLRSTPAPRCTCAHCIKQEHSWRPVGDGEVREEVSICDNCGLYASESEKPCRDQTCVACGYYASEHTEQGCPGRHANQPEGN